MKIRFLFIIICLVLFQCSDIFNSTEDKGDNKTDGNDKMSSATPYIVGQTAKFKLDYENDVDFYKVKIDTSGLYLLSINNIPSTLSMWVYILNSEGKQLFSKSKSSNETEISLGELLSQGEYYIEMKTGYYEYSNQEMTIKLIRDTVDTFEINNAFSTATPTIATKYYKGTLYPESDSDFYSIKLDSNQITRFQLDSVSSLLNVSFVLLNDEGVDLKANTSITSDKPLDIAYALKKGTYYAKIYAGYFESSPKPYRFRYYKDTTDQTEWNNDTANAVKLEFGKTVEAALYPAGDTDYFEISLTNADTVTINVDSISTALPNFRVRILDRDLTEQGYTYPVSGTIRFKKFLAAGKYYLMVFSGESYLGQISFRKYYLSIQKAGL